MIKFVNLNSDVSKKDMVNPDIQKGFVALTSILVVSGLVMIVATSITLLGIGEGKSSHDFRKGMETLKIAEGCLEEAALRIRNDPLYTGTQTPLVLGKGNCNISVTASESNRNVIVEAEIPGQPFYKKKIEANFRVVGNSANITSWQENE